MDSLRLYFRYLGVSVRAQMQYRLSFLLYAFGQFLLTAVEFLTIWALFDRFRHLKGWSLPEVALLYGMASVSFALGGAFSRGFDQFATLVKSGDFDRLLLRPRGTAFQVAAGQLELTRLGRFAQGAIVLAWAIPALGANWGLAQVGLFVAAILAGGCLFVALFVLQATAAFWTTEGLEIANAITYGGMETTQYPITIYAKWLQRFFTLVVPLACMNYFPAIALTGHADALGAPAWVPWASPLVGPLFLLVCLRLWNVGVRHYRSTGS